MSLNYPTAFWKHDPETESVPDVDISWETSLAWSFDTPGNDPSVIGVTDEFPIKHESSYPFIVNIDPYVFDDEYYSYYGSLTTLVTKIEGDTSSNIDLASLGFPSDQVFYGWYLNGGINAEGEEYPAPHRAEPWIIEQENEYISLNFEADAYSALDRDPDYGYDAAIQKYNPFIQSGSATGTFTLTSTTKMEVQVSGLARDSTWTASWNRLGYAQMTMHLYDQSADTETLLCSGHAPQDERFDSNSTPAIGVWDMQQVKLYSGNDLETIINYQGKNGGTKDTDKGAVRSSPNSIVNEDNRTTYVNDNGTGVFFNKGTSTALSAGTYQVRINASTMDGTYSSGAFYGFKFTFS